MRQLSIYMYFIVLLLLLILCLLSIINVDAFTLFRKHTSAHSTSPHSHLDSSNVSNSRTDACVTPFGTLLGYANNVPAFSNCNSHFRSTHTSYTRLGYPHDVEDPYDPSITNRFMTGMRYDAQDYVNRWWVHNRGLVSALVERPESIWGALTLTNPAKTSQQWEVVKIFNNELAKTADEIRYLAPRSGDCVIYASENNVNGMTGGHAAMVVKVEDDAQRSPRTSITSSDAHLSSERNTDRKDKDKDKDKDKSYSSEFQELATLSYSERRRMRLQPRKVYIAEQNFDNKPWDHNNYSRLLSFTWSDAPTRDGYIGSLHDTHSLHIVGRVRIGAMKEELPEEDPYKRGLETIDKDDQHDLERISEENLL